METKEIDLNNDPVFLDDVAESIFDKATSIFSETFDEAEFAIDSDNMGLSVTETKSNENECQQLIAYIKQIVNDSYSDIFDVSIERHECNDDEFPDDVANIIINLSWGKINKNS
jgi:hypothetical protein